MTRIVGPAAAALTVACGLLLARGLSSLHPTLCCDAQGYFDLTQALLSQGPRALASHVRTYGYPAFLAWISLWQPRPVEWIHAAAAGAQGALAGAAAVISYRYAKRTPSSRAIAVIVAGSVLLNPVLLARASELLTELISAVLLYLALLPAIAKASPEDAPRRAAASLLAASAAAVVRPANTVLLGAFLLLWLYRAVSLRPRFAPLAVAALLLSVAVPLLPQSLINRRYTGTLNPFVISGQYRYQTGWGMRGLKYGTVVIPGKSPYLLYTNPFYDEAWASPGEFLLHSPLLYATTLAIHGFALLDQDTLFTYVTDLRPWYRWPISLGNYGWIFIALLGACCAILRRGPCREDPDLRRAVLLSVALIGVYLAFHLPTLVEARFATPIYLLGVPLFAVGVRLLARIFEKRSWRRGLQVGCASLVFLVACASLSGWIQAHAVYPNDPRSIQPAPRGAR